MPPTAAYPASGRRSLREPPLAARRPGHHPREGACDKAEGYRTARLAEEHQGTRQDLSCPLLFKLEFDHPYNLP